MNYYLTTWTTIDYDGETNIIPAGCEKADKWNSLDLRPTVDLNRPTGFVLIGTPEKLPEPAIKITDGIKKQLDAPKVSLLKEKLGVKLKGKTLADILKELFVDHADEKDKQKIDPIPPDMRGRTAIYLGNEEVAL